MPMYLFLFDGRRVDRDTLRILPAEESDSPTGPVFEIANVLRGTSMDYLFFESRGKPCRLEIPLGWFYYAGWFYKNYGVACFDCLSDADRQKLQDYDPAKASVEKFFNKVSGVTNFVAPIKEPAQDGASCS